MANLAYSDIIMYTYQASGSSTGGHRSVPGMTANHVLLNDNLFPGINISWETQSSGFDISANNGTTTVVIPEGSYKLYFGIPES